MGRRHRDTIYISITTAVRQTGLSPEGVREWVERRLVGESLSADDVAELRRIRRLQELGVNMPGIEIILHMRRRLQALHADLDRWQQLQGATDWSELGARWQRLLTWEQDSE